MTVYLYKVCMSMHACIIADMHEGVHVCFYVNICIERERVSKRQADMYKSVCMHEFMYICT